MVKAGAVGGHGVVVDAEDAGEASAVAVDAVYAVGEAAAEMVKRGGGRRAQWWCTRWPRPWWASESVAVDVAAVDEAAVVIMDKVDKVVGRAEWTQWPR